VKVTPSSELGGYKKKNGQKGTSVGPKRKEESKEGSDLLGEVSGARRKGG